MVVVPAAGSTTILTPVPAEIPPHEPVNHCQLAPVPKLPPVTVSVFAIPLQVLLFEIVIPVGSVDKLPTGQEQMVLHADAVQP